MSDCCTAFERFAGLPVEAQQSFYEFRRSYGSPAEARSRFRVFKLDPVLLEMKKIAAANGLTLRITGPDDKGCPDINLKRVNVSLKRSGAQWVVSPEFRIG